MALTTFLRSFSSYFLPFSVTSTLQYNFSKYCDLVLFSIVFPAPRTAELSIEKAVNEGYLCIIGNSWHLLNSFPSFIQFPLASLVSVIHFHAGHFVLASPDHSYDARPCSKCLTYASSSCGPMRHMLFTCTFYRRGN